MKGSVETGLPLAERAARHLRWSAAVSDAFRSANGLRPWRPATLIFGLRAKRMVSLVRRVLNYRLSWPRVDLTIAVANNTLVQPLISVGQTNPPVSAHSNRHTGGLRATAQTIWRIQTHQTASAVETRFEHRMWLGAPALARTQRLPSQTSTTSAGRRANGAGATEANGREMSTRIAQRLRRVEQARPAQEPKVVAGAAPRRGFEEIVDTQVPRPHLEANPGRRSESSAAGLTLPSMNVTQLTDEVMRQIDRRLVAYRERMGKV